MNITCTGIYIPEFPLNEKVCDVFLAHRLKWGGCVDAFEEQTHNQVVKTILINNCQ